MMTLCDDIGGQQCYQCYSGDHSLSQDHVFVSLSKKTSVLAEKHNRVFMLEAVNRGLNLVLSAHHRFLFFLKDDRSASTALFPQLFTNI